VVGTLDWSPERTTTGGTLHGGALMGLADVVGAVCAFLHLPEGAGTATVSSSTNFLRAVPGAKGLNALLETVSTPTGGN
jgi:1,4-dihydroxy-2-naphthoyl-CoA hydrolase